MVVFAAVAIFLSSPLHAQAHRVKVISTDGAPVVYAYVR